MLVAMIDTGRSDDAVRAQDRARWRARRLAGIAVGCTHGAVSDRVDTWTSAHSFQPADITMHDGDAPLRVISRPLSPSGVTFLHVRHPRAVSRLPEARVVQITGRPFGPVSTHQDHETRRGERGGAPSDGRAEPLVTVIAVTSHVERAGDVPRDRRVPRRGPRVAGCAGLNARGRSSASPDPCRQVIRRLISQDPSWTASSTMPSTVARTPGFSPSDRPRTTPEQCAVPEHRLNRAGPGPSRGGGSGKRLALRRRDTRGLPLNPPCPSLATGSLAIAVVGARGLRSSRLSSPPLESEVRDVFPRRHPAHAWMTRTPLHNAARIGPSLCLEW